MSEATPGGAPRRNRSLFSGTLGATLEWYDFTLYVYLAPVISVLFFPSSSPIDSLLATFGVFAAGYLMRPLGAAVIGNYGDTHGRRAALLFSITAMGAGMFVIAVLPTESSIGVLAPIALVLVRLVQGFSLGGEFGGAITLLAEAAPAMRRGWTVNFAQVSAGVGTLMSSGLVVVLHSFLSDSQMQDFGWRIPFLIGGLLGVIAIVALLRTPESKMFSEEAEADVEVPIKDLLHTERRPLVLNSLLNGYQSLSYYIIVTFVPTYLVAFEKAPPEEGVLAGVVAALVFTLISPPAGGLSDRFGRRPVLLAALVGMAIGAVPLFVVLGEVALGAVIPAQLALMAMVTLFSGAALVTGCELFTTRTRYSGVSIGFNVGATVFGGTAPLIATGLIKLTDYNQAPAVLLAVAALLTLIVVRLIPETAPVRTADGPDEPPVPG